jgi:hypothetical protein
MESRERMVRMNVHAKWTPLLVALALALAFTLAFLRIH